MLDLFKNTRFFAQNNALGGVLERYKENEWFSIGVAFLAFFSPGNISKLGLIFKYQRLFQGL